MDSRDSQDIHASSWSRLWRPWAPDVFPLRVCGERDTLQSSAVRRRTGDRAMPNRKTPRRDPYKPSGPIETLAPERLVGMEVVAAATGLTRKAVWLRVKEQRCGLPWTRRGRRWVIPASALSLAAPKVPFQEAGRRGRAERARLEAAKAAQASTTAPAPEAPTPAP